MQQSGLRNTDDTTEQAAWRLQTQLRTLRKPDASDATQPLARNVASVLHSPHNEPNIFTPYLIIISLGPVSAVPMPRGVSQTIRSHARLWLCVPRTRQKTWWGNSPRQVSVRSALLHLSCMHATSPRDRDPKRAAQCALRGHVPYTRAERIASWTQMPLPPPPPTSPPPSPTPPLLLWTICRPMASRGVCTFPHRLTTSRSAAILGHGHGWRRSHAAPCDAGFCSHASFQSKSRIC